ncbi:hypothetical protein X801_10679, partial [Opisthorchis viverrini]
MGPSSGIEDRIGFGTGKYSGPLVVVNAEPFPTATAMRLANCNWVEKSLVVTAGRGNGPKEANNEESVGINPEGMRDVNPTRDSAINEGKETATLGKLSGVLKPSNVPEVNGCACGLRVGFGSTVVGKRVVLDRGDRLCVGEESGNVYTLAGSLLVLGKYRDVDLGARWPPERLGSGFAENLENCFVFCGLREVSDENDKRLLDEVARRHIWLDCDVTGLTVFGTVGFTILSLELRVPLPIAGVTEQAEAGFVHVEMGVNTILGGDEVAEEPDPTGVHGRIGEAGDRSIGVDERRGGKRRPGELGASAALLTAASVASKSKTDVELDGSMSTAELGSDLVTTGSSSEEAGGNEELNSGVGDGLVLKEELVMVDSSVMVLNSRTSGVASTCDARGSVETSNIEFGATFSSAQPVAPSLAYEE